MPPDYGTDQETELAGNTEDESESETESESVAESETETEELLLEETESESEAESELGAMSGTCGLNGAKVQWALDDSGTLTVSGSGAMDDYYVYRDLTTGSVVESHLPPWNDIRIRSKITSVVIADGVTSVGQNAFGNCYSLEKVIVGNSVKTIKNSAFSDCGMLKEIRLGNKIESIGNHAFYYSPVTGLTLPASLKTLSRYALTGLWEMQNVSVALGSSVFQSRDGVLMTDGGKTLVYYPAGRTGAYAIPNGVTKIGAYAFSQALVTGVTIPNTVTELGETAFSECDGLTSLVIPGSVKAVPSFFCYACQNLSSVSLGNGLKEIGTYAFKGCEALKTVTIPASVTSIGENAFSSGTKVTISTGGLHRQEDGSYIDALKVKVNVQEKYKTAFEILTLVNKERAKAGVPALKMDQSLLESAMQRAAETSLYWSHTRPTGSNCFSANSLMRGENIAYGVSSASAVMNMWMNSSGHRANILGSGYTSIGIGCVKTDTGYYYVQCSVLAQT